MWPSALPSDTFLVCIVIPIYNHQDQIGETVARLIAYGLPIRIVDDGSNAATQTVLAALAEQYAGRITVQRLAKNGGKGAAVIAGLLAARAARFTHALQIDADGQHDTADVPRFIAAGMAEPHALVLGRPVYDDSVPLSRLYGRYITHAWVWIETLSLTIRDAMCGFRLYPLRESCRLIDEVALPARMDFDIAILVRLYWRNIAFRTLDTRVTYAADGLSHFDMVWDNARISLSHIKLVTGMLWRVPLLIGHKVQRTQRRTRAASDLRRKISIDTAKPLVLDTTKAKAIDTTHMQQHRDWWQIRERGTALGMRFLATSSALLGRRITGCFLHPIVAYFVVSSPAVRAASSRYFAALGRAASEQRMPKPGWFSCYRHVLSFAQSGCDKFAAWTGRIRFESVRFDDPLAFTTLVQSGKGALVVGAHLGNLEMTRALAIRDGRAKVTAIVYIEHAKRFNKMLAAANSTFASKLVEVRDFGPETAMMMQERIDAGELLVIVGDRVPANEMGRTVAVPFLGEMASFAQGPYVLAHALGCPVYLVFCLKEGGIHHLYFEHFAERICLPRKERTQQVALWAGRFADRLAYYVQKSPYQWFNFYDFWARDQHGVSKHER